MSDSNLDHLDKNKTMTSSSELKTSNDLKTPSGLKNESAASLVTSNAATTSPAASAASTVPEPKPAAKPQTTEATAAKPKPSKKAEITEEKQRLILSASPHAHAGTDTRRIMLDVIIALMPALFFSVYFFGLRALILTAVTVLSCVFFEWLSRKILKRSCSIGDCSAIVTGLLLAFNLPPSLPVWMAVLGSAVSIIVVKQFFGGIGQNFVNPALLGRIVLLSSFPTQMATWTQSQPWMFTRLDGVTTASPLHDLPQYFVDPSTRAALPSLFDMLIGNRPGSLGETSALALLIGFLYLLYRKVISPVIPLTYVGVFSLLTLFAGQFDLTFLLYHILGGGLLLGAIFMATDYSTCPLHLRGKIIYAFGCALITFLIRFYGSLPEGVSFSIILMNLCVPLIERYTLPKAFGYQKAPRAKKERSV